MNTTNIDTITNALFSDDEDDVVQAPAPLAKVTREQLLDAALDYAARGLMVFPLQVNGKLPAIGKLKEEDQVPGSHWNGNGFKDASTDPFVIRDWWKDNAYNIGIRTGTGLRLVVVDFDIPKEDAKKPWTEKNQSDYEAFEKQVDSLGTLKSITRSGGRHYVFRVKEGVTLPGNKTGAPIRCVDVRGEGGYIAVEPSVVDGKTYKWQAPVVVADMVVAPDWLLERISEKDDERESKAKRALATQSTRVPVATSDKRKSAWLEVKFRERVAGVANMGEGGRNDELFKATVELAEYAHHGVFSGMDIQTAMYQACVVNGLADDGENYKLTIAGALEKGLQGRKDVELADRALPAPSGTPAFISDSSVQIGGDVHRTDTGNADIWVRLFGDEFRVVSYGNGDGGDFVSWNGKFWDDQNGNALALNSTKHISKMWFKRADSIETKFPDGEDNKVAIAKKKEINTWGFECESSSRRTAMLKMAKSEPAIRTPAAEFDSKHMLFNVQNGTLDLASGALLPHSREHMLTRVSGVSYDPNAKCPNFDAFIEDIIPDPETRRWVQKFFGYSLTGEIREHIFTVLVGEGRNGKGTLLSLVKEIMGPKFAVAIDQSLIIDQSNEPHSTVKMTLRGSRLAVAAETAKGAKFSTSKVKALASKDAIRARAMGKDEIEFIPTHKLLLQTNDVPHARASDRAFWARMRIIKFEKDYMGREDLTLEARLMSELEGILNWMVAGVKLWLEEGLAPSAEMQKSAKAEKDENDNFLQFIEDKCTFWGDGHVLYKDLYSSYVTWAKERGLDKPMTLRGLLKEFKSLKGEQAVEEYKFTGGARGYTGVSIQR